MFGARSWYRSEISTGETSRDIFDWHTHGVRLASGSRGQRCCKHLVAHIQDSPRSEEWPARAPMALPSRRPAVGRHVCVASDDVRKGMSLCRRDRFCADPIFLFPSLSQVQPAPAYWFFSYKCRRNKIALGESTWEERKSASLWNRELAFCRADIWKSLCLENRGSIRSKRPLKAIWIRSEQSRGRNWFLFSYMRVNMCQLRFEKILI